MIPSLFRLLAAGIFVLFTCTAPVEAHEFGSMKVEVSISADRFTVDLTLFPEHLRPEQRRGDRDFSGYAASLAAGARIVFDGVVASPEIQVRTPIGDSADPNIVPPPAIRMSGAVPAGAQTFTWSHAWPVDEYLLCVRTGGTAETEYQWVRASSESRPVNLNNTAGPSEPFQASVQPRNGLTSTIRQYVVLGFEHIVPRGLDHILFVLSLFLLSLRPRDILAQVTAFTVAHSITLALSMYGLVQLPSSIVEPLIAASIVFVAVENVIVRQARPHRTALVFAFGLLHGLGFAGVLTELGLPRQQFIPALISFNVGVELGQLAVIAGAYLAVGLWFGRRHWYRAAVTVPASIAIALVGAWWFIERVS